MSATLLIGFLIGMQHALEADHVAAVWAIAARESSPRRIIRHGMVWGLGHTLTLLAFAGGAVVFHAVIGERLAMLLEFGVGIMLVGLGAHVLWRLARERVHIHAHRHDGDTVHFHAHNHRGEAGAHDPTAHSHDHADAFPVRTLVVGLMHGMAGSAALLVLAAAALPTATAGLIYVTLFGVGSILGMAVLSAVISVPLAWSARFLTRANAVLQGSIGVATIALGVVVTYTTAGAWTATF